MDIRHIIARLQDIDKLKVILLDKKQRKIFDTIPKFAIRGKSKSKKRETLTIEDMAKSQTRKISWHLKSEKYKFLFNDDPINKRLLQLMDPATKTLIEQSKTERKGFLYIAFLKITVISIFQRPKKPSKSFWKQKTLKKRISRLY